MEAKYTKAINIIKRLRALAEEDEKIREQIHRQLRPFSSDVAQRRESAREAAGLVADLTVRYGHDPTIRELIRRAFFNNNINTEEQ